ncbi:unnamed protein product [Onchocerca flexuosa]|nr:unnamed protein product [Onchocerca flexuosa]
MAELRRLALNEECSTTQLREMINSMLISS